MNNGKVYLIGAGPGDPGLLTCKAKQLLTECDVVCYDKLVGAAILSLVPNHVQMYEVGYLGYQGTHIDYGMHPDVMEFALAGKRVARLKSGDPCIFGRMTEECRDLNRHGIAYEIIPGITAALGAASYSGFPLTSGGIASSVTFVSGHKHLNTISSWGESGQAGGTLVLYMGAKKLADHVDKLIKNGRKPETPIALISSATRADHSCLIATLETVIELMESHQLTGPTLTIVGDVVTQNREFDWRSKQALSDTRFLICGEYHGARALQDEGAELISIVDLPTESLIDGEDLKFLSTQKGLSFSDRASFNIWKQALLDNQWDIRKFSMPMGSKKQLVREAMRQFGITPEMLPKNSIVLTLCEEFIFETSHQYYLVGRRKSDPIGYKLPTVNWILVENIFVAKSIAAQQPDVFENAVVVPLNKEVHSWAMNEGYLTKDSYLPEFFELPEQTVSRECPDVA
ncbi:MAG: uroporphyrinogen-III C-methyltransferase [Shewanella sp.]